MRQLMLPRPKSYQELLIRLRPGHKKVRKSILEDVLLNRWQEWADYRTEKERKWQADVDEFERTVLQGGRG